MNKYLDQINPSRTDYFKEIEKELAHTRNLLDETVGWICEHCSTDEESVMALRHCGFTDDDIKYYNLDV